MIPAECMEYTQVFRALKLEFGIVAIVALLLGIWIGRRGDD
jgi:hypothetical protein